MSATSGTLPPFIASITEIPSRRYEWHHVNKGHNPFLKLFFSIILIVFKVKKKVTKLRNCPLIYQKSRQRKEGRRERERDNWRGGGTVIE